MSTILTCIKLVAESRPETISSPETLWTSAFTWNDNDEHHEQSNIIILFSVIMIRKDVILTLLVMLS